MSNRPLNRREFTGLCAASLASVPVALAMPLGASAQTAPTATRTVKFRDGKTVPALGQGSARLAKGRRPQAEEQEAVRAGISLGMTVIDTAEIYGSEEFIGR
ncbi:MAG: aldo/keto reductase, partial [Pseudolabrys sp.]